MTGVMVVLFIGYTIAVWVVYHKIFDVVYFDLKAGLGKELFGSIVGGLILSTLTLTFWWVVDIIIAIIAIIFAVKLKKPEVKITAVVLAIVIAVLISATGISFNKKQAEKQENEDEYSYVIETMQV